MADNHNILSFLIIGLLGFSSFYFLPPSVGAAPGPDAVTTTTNQALAPMTTNKVFNTFGSCFQNQCTQAIRYLFKPNGFAAWHNVGSGNITLNSFTVGGQSRSVSAFSNSTTIDYRISVPGIVTMDIYFKETPTNGRPSNTFKVTMIGTSSVSGTFTWNFGNPNNFPITCDNTKKILTYGVTGINFTDSVNFNATCTNTTLSFTIGVGAFKIDPTTITTVVSNANTAGDNAQTPFGLINTRYWVFYSDATNCVIRSSLNGVTWSSATTVRTCAFASIDTVVDDSTNRFWYVWFPTTGSSSTINWRSGILNSDGTITYDFAEQSITTTGTNANPSSPRLIITPAGDLIVMVNTLQSSVNHIEVWKCTGATSSCTPSKIQDTTTNAAGKRSRSLAFSDSSIAMIWATGTGTTTLDIQTCPSSCASSGDWNALKATTSAYDNTGSGEWDAVTVGTSIYFAGKTSSTTIKYWTCAYPCSSSPSETTITSSATTVFDVTISTDKFQSTGTATLAIAYGDSGANIIAYFASFNTGSTWSSVSQYVTSETNLCSSCVSANKKLLNGILNLAWLAGAASPFNFRFTSIGINGPSIIQSTSCTGTGSSVNCAFASNTKASSSIVVFTGATATTTVTSVTDSQLSTYVLIVASDVGTVGDDEAWWACHPSTAAADTITVNYGVSVTSTIILYELHGRPTGTGCAPSSSTGSSASASSAAVTSYTPTANAFIIGALNSNCQVACTITAGSGYSLDKNVAINAVNMFTTEYFWNVATADTTPYTFSLASAYNEISVAFYDLTWTNKTLADSATAAETIFRTPTPSIKDSFSLPPDNIPIVFKPIIADSLSLAEIATGIRGAIRTLADTFNIIVTIPVIAGGNPSVIPVTTSNPFPMLGLFVLVAFFLFLAAKRRK